MAAKRKPAARRKPAAGGCGCGSLVLLLLCPIIIPLALLLWVCGVFSAGLLGAAFYKPPRGD